MDKTYQLYLDDRISKAGFGKRYKPMEERIGQIDDQIPRLEGDKSLVSEGLGRRFSILTVHQLDPERPTTG